MPSMHLSLCRLFQLDVVYWTGRRWHQFTEETGQIHELFVSCACRSVTHPVMVKR